MERKGRGPGKAPKREEIKTTIDPAIHAAIKAYLAEHDGKDGMKRQTLAMVLDMALLLFLSVEPKGE